MSAGVRAEVRLEAREECPIAGISEEIGESIHTISKSTIPGTDEVVEEFTLSANSSIDDLAMSTTVTEMFSYHSKSVYRFNRSLSEWCPCDVVEQFGCPIINVRANNGHLSLTFHAPGMDELSETISTLRESFNSVGLMRLFRSDVDAGDNELVFVDRGTLTDRQLEVLETAHDMGYFDHPKESNAGEVAAELGITTSTFTEHLSAAQRKLLQDILEY